MTVISQQLHCHDDQDAHYNPYILNQRVYQPICKVLLHKVYTRGIADNTSEVIVDAGTESIQAMYEEAKRQKPGHCHELALHLL